MKLNLSAGTENPEEQLSLALEEAKKHKADVIEISYGTGLGEIKSRILNFLMKKENRSLYSRLVKSKQGWGRIFVYFRWK